LDAWTSSNGHGFLAIVMHYISNEWRLGNLITNRIKAWLIAFILPEELLIDFRELIGEHSGQNMAHAVYETQGKYGLKGRASGSF
jgi:hypothetical protein